MDEKDLRNRVRNPNKEFDSFFWRPKNKLLRTIVNKYINIIEILGYAFGITMLAAIIYAWFVQHDEWTGWHTAKLKPATVALTVAGRGMIGTVRAGDLQEVVAGDTVASIAYDQGGLGVMIASNAGVFVLSDDSITPGRTLDSGAVLGSVLEFGNFTIDVDLSGKSIDSVGVGDSVQLLVDRECDQNFIINARLPDTTMNIKYVSARPEEFNARMDAFKGFLKEKGITSDQQGVYPVDNVGVPEVMIEAKFKPGGGALDPGAKTFFGRPFRGVFESGTRHLSIDMGKPFPDSVTSRLNSWVRDSLLGGVVGVDGRPYELDGVSLVLVKTVAIDGSAALETYVPFKKRPKRMKGYPSRSFKVKGVIRVGTPPDYISQMAKNYYLAKKEYVDVRLRVNSFRISWGKKLVRKK